MVDSLSSLLFNKNPLFLKKTQQHHPSLPLPDTGSLHEWQNSENGKQESATTHACLTIST